MGIDIFGVNVDKPSREYSSGEKVTGKVFIRISGVETTSGTTFSKINIRFFGTAITQWVESYYDHSSYDYRTRNYDGQEAIFNISTRLFGDGNHHIQIPAGDNVFPFTFQVPVMPLPVSCIFQEGQVTYGLEALISVRYQSYRKTSVVPVIIFPVVDLNLTPGAANPWRVSHNQSFGGCCCPNKPCFLESFTPKAGFCPGEVVPFVLEFQNQSDRSITNITATLIQEWTLNAFGFHGGLEQRKYPNSLLTASHPEVGPGETTKWEVDFIIPPKVPPTPAPGTSEIFKLEYMINVCAEVEGDSIFLSHPLIIGTIPLKGNTVLQQQIPKYNQKGALA